MKEQQYHVSLLDTQVRGRTVLKRDKAVWTSELKLFRDCSGSSSQTVCAFTSELVAGPGNWGRTRGNYHFLWENAQKYSWRGRKLSVLSTWVSFRDTYRHSYQGHLLFNLPVDSLADDVGPCGERGHVVFLRYYLKVREEEARPSSLTWKPS